MNNNYFNKQDVYDSQIKDLVQELKRICCKEKMPMFFAVCVSNNETETQYEKEVVSAGTNEVSLTTDLIPGLINVTLGFDTMLPQSVPSIDFE